MGLRRWLQEPFKAEAQLMAGLTLGLPLLMMVAGIAVVLYLQHCVPEAATLTNCK
jgi:hypothetical protein